MSVEAITEENTLTEQQQIETTSQSHLVDGKIIDIAPKVDPGDLLSNTPSGYRPKIKCEEINGEIDTDVLHNEMLDPLARLIAQAIRSGLEQGHYVVENGIICAKIRQRKVA